MHDETDISESKITEELGSGLESILPRSKSVYVVPPAKASPICGDRLTVGLIKPPGNAPKKRKSVSRSPKPCL